MSVTDKMYNLMSQYFILNSHTEIMEVLNV